jgi:hypothetical protein
MSMWTTGRPIGAPDIFTDDGLLDEAKFAAHQQQVAEQFGVESAKFVASSQSEAEMRAITDEIILWGQDTSAYLFGPVDENNLPLYGKVDIPKILTLLQNGETAILNYKASELKPDALVRQYEWLIARSVQANTLMNLVALNR